MPAGGQPGQGRRQVEGTGFALRFQRERFHIFGRCNFSDDRLRELGERTAGADFEERPHAVAEHRPNLADEFHRLRQLVAEQVSTSGSVGRIFRRRGVRIHRQTGEEFDGAKLVEERPRRIGDEFAMERGCDGELHRADAVRCERVGDPVDVGTPAGEHRLLRAVLVRDHHTRCQQRFDFVEWRDHGEHRAGVADALGSHQLAAPPGEPGEIGDRNPPAGRESGEFAVAVSGEAVGSEVEAFVQHTVGPVAHGAEGGLGDVGRLQFVVLFRLRIRGKGSRRIDEVAQASTRLHGVGVGQGV